jgi:hypothetical protein
MVGIIGTSSEREAQQPDGAVKITLHQAAGYSTGIDGLRWASTVIAKKTAFPDTSEGHKVRCVPARMCGTGVYQGVRVKKAREKPQNPV